MNITDKQSITTVREVIVGKICDFCKKPVDPINYFVVTTSHNDWGNDSVESIVHKDACSPECVLTFATDYITKSFEDVVNTRTIEVEHRRYIPKW